MKECIFCKIVQGELPSDTLYEDNLVKVFLNITPSTNGDALIIPKEHIVDVNGIDDDLLLHLHHVSKQMKNLLEERLGCTGFTFAQNNGTAQEMKHYHIHLTPRYLDDEVDHVYNKEILLLVEEINQKLHD